MVEHRPTRQEGKRMSARTIEPPESPLAATLEAFFTTKTACDLEGTMSYFSPNLASYIDATLGWSFDSYDVWQAVFAEPCRSGRLRLARIPRECCRMSRAPLSTWSTRPSCS